MGTNFSSNQDNKDIQFDNLNNDLKVLIHEAESLIKHNFSNNRYFDLKNLIEKDIQLIKDYLNHNFDLSAGAFCINEKLTGLVNTLFAEKINFNKNNYNIVKNENRRLFDYEKKLMNFNEAYSKNKDYFNYIFNNEIKNFQSRKKIIFSNHLNDQNFLADEVLFSIPPIHSNDKVKFNSLKKEIEQISDYFNKFEKDFLNGTDYNEFINDSLNTQENNFDTLMKFLFMLINHDVIIYIFGNENGREIYLFKTIIANSFIRSIIKHKKLFLIFPNTILKSQSQIKLEEIISKANIEVHYLDFDDCYDDKLIFLAKLILKRDPRSYFIPDILKHKIEKILRDEISISYEKLKEEFEEFTKQQKIKAEKIIENTKTNPILGGGDESKEETKEKKKSYFSKFMKYINQKLINKVNERYSIDSNRLISKYEFEQIYIENMDTDFKTNSKIDKFEDSLYDSLKSELISKQNIIQSHLIFKCLLYKSLNNDQDFSNHNFILSKRNEILESIDNLNYVVEKAVEEFLKDYNSNIYNYLSTLEIIDADTDTDNKKPSNQTNKFLDVLRNENFCEDYRELCLLEDNFSNFEKSNIDKINVLSNYIQEHSAKSMEIIVNQYYTLNGIFLDNKIKTEDHYVSTSFNSYKDNYEKQNSSYNKNFSYEDYRSIKLENCRSNLNIVISKKIQSFNLIHMILFNHYGFKNMNIKKPSSGYRSTFLIGVCSFLIFGIMSTFMKYSKKLKIITGITSLISLAMGSYFGNLFKIEFVQNCKKFLKINQFFLSRYFKMRLVQNTDLSQTLMKYFKNISEESLELMNSIALIGKNN